MKEAAKVQKQQMEKFDMDAVEDLFDDMADMVADQEEINEMMSRNFGVEYDENELMDELSGVRTEDPGSEDLVGPLTGENFDHTINILVSSCSRVGHERERTDVVLDSFSLELLF